MKARLKTFLGNFSALLLGLNFYSLPLLASDSSDLYGATFEVEMGALYLKPGGSRLHYAAVADPLPLPTPNWKIYDIKPDYHMGYEVGLSWLNCDRSAKLQLNWTHFNSSSSASVAAGENNMVGPFFEIGPDAALYSFSKGNVSYNFNAGTLRAAFAHCWSDSLSTHFFAGVGAVNIKEHLKAGYFSSDGLFTKIIKTPTSYWGVGPELGLDFSYAFCSGFSFTGEGSGALLVGTGKNHTHYDSYSPFLPELDITPPNSQKTSVNDRTLVVPAFKGKLGLSYLFDLCGAPVALEAGYQVQLYLNALQSTDIGSEVVTPPVAPDTVGVYARTFHRSLSNFALAGPYVKLEIRF